MNYQPRSTNPYIMEKKLNKCVGGGGLDPSILEEIEAEISVLGSENATMAQDIIDIKGSLNSISDNLSELTKYQFGNVVDIKSYTYAEPYTCPSDGYIWITSGYEASKYTTAKLNNTFGVYAIGNTATGGITTCFVKKGMTVGINTNSGNDCQAKFYPLA